MLKIRADPLSRHSVFVCVPMFVLLGHNANVHPENVDAWLE